MDTGIVREIAIVAVPLLIAITFHEAAHGFVAYRLGDKTAWAVGRMTLNPIKHIDPVGTVLVPLLLMITAGTFFGYAKPVPINPRNFSNPKRDMAISAAAGPVTNIVLAVISLVIVFYIIPLISIVTPDSVDSSVLLPLREIFVYSIKINVFLACFNMIPIPPLDGGRVAVGLLPGRQAIALSRLEPYGFIILIILIVTGLYRYFVLPLYSIIMAFLSLLY